MGDCRFKKPRKVISTRPEENFDTKLIVTGEVNFGVLFESFFSFFLINFNPHFRVFFIRKKLEGLEQFVKG